MTKNELRSFVNKSAKFIVPVFCVIGTGVIMHELGYRKGVFDAANSAATWMRASAADKPDWLLKDFVETEIDTGHLPYRYSK